MTDNNFGTRPFSGHSAGKNNRYPRPGSDSALSPSSDLPLDLIEGLVRPVPEHGDFLDDFEAFDDIGTLTHNPFSPALADPFRLDNYPEDDDIGPYSRNPLKTNPVLRGGLIGTGSLAITLAIGSTLSDQHNLGLTTGAIQPIDLATFETTEPKDEIVSEPLPPQVQAAITNAVEFSSSETAAPSPAQRTSTESSPFASSQITAGERSTQPASVLTPARVSGLEQEMRNLEQVLKRIESLPIPVANYSTPPAVGANLPRVPIPQRDRQPASAAAPTAPRSVAPQPSAPAVSALPETSPNVTRLNPNLDSSPRIQPAAFSNSPSVQPAASSTPPAPQPAVSTDWSIDRSLDLETGSGNGLGAANVSPPEPWINTTADSSSALETTIETPPPTLTDSVPAVPTPAPAISQ